MHVKYIHNYQNATIGLAKSLKLLDNMEGLNLGDDTKTY